jgi:uncharacterized protein (DUF1778 family)
MAKLVDARDLKSLTLTGIPVRFRVRAPSVFFFKEPMQDRPTSLHFFKRSSIGTESVKTPMGFGRNVGQLVHPPVTFHECSFALASSGRYPRSYPPLLCTALFRTKENHHDRCASRPAPQPTDKDRIARAADLRGVPVSAIVRDAVLREAENVMAAELTVILSPADSRRFLAALGKPFKPNAKLKKAMERGLDRR